MTTTEIQLSSVEEVETGEIAVAVAVGVAPGLGMNRAS